MLRTAFAAGTLVCAVSLAALCHGQPGPDRPRGYPGGGKGGRDKDEEAPRLPTDERLLALHKEFVLKAEKLAKEYEGKKQYDKAKDVCDEILKLVPQYPPARDMVDSILQREATAERVVMDVHADQGWQDTGVTVIAGKPLTITSKGSWTLHVEYELTPEGMEVPKEWREYRFGALIAFIDTGERPDPKAKEKGTEEDKFRPFHVGASKQFIVENTGKLLLRMHDSDHRDNKGRVQVEIVGSFQKGKKS